MAKVRKANVFLTIDDSQIEKYVANGFDVVDNRGNILQATIPNDINVLKKAYVDNIAEIESLKQRINTLEAEISDFRKTDDKIVKSSTNKRNKRNIDE